MKAAALILLFAAAPAAAEDCGRYDEPLAYNACLARQGPAAPAVHVSPAPAAGALRAPARRGHGRVVAVGRRGRNEMVFSVGK